MVESEFFLQEETNQSISLNGKKICACGKQVNEIYQYNLCKECLTERFKELIKVIDSVRSQRK